MTDQELLDYVWAHSQTPRALFHVKHLIRLMTLAGSDVPDLTGEWYALHFDVAEPLVRAARARLAA